MINKNINLSLILLIVLTIFSQTYAKVQTSVTITTVPDNKYMDIIGAVASVIGLILLFILGRCLASIETPTQLTATSTHNLDIDAFLAPGLYVQKASAILARTQGLHIEPTLANKYATQQSGAMNKLKKIIDAETRHASNAAKSRRELKPSELKTHTAQLIQNFKTAYNQCKLQTTELISAINNVNPVDTILLDLLDVRDKAYVAYLQWTASP